MKYSVTDWISALFMADITHRYSLVLGAGLTPDLVARLDLSGSPDVAAKSLIRSLHSFGISPNGDKWENIVTLSLINTALPPEIAAFYNT